MEEFHFDIRRPWQGGWTWWKKCTIDPDSQTGILLVLFSFICMGRRAQFDLRLARDRPNRPVDRQKSRKPNWSCSHRLRQPLVGGTEVHLDQCCDHSAQRRPRIGTHSFRHTRIDNQGAFQESSCDPSWLLIEVVAVWRRQACGWVIFSPAHLVEPHLSLLKWKSKATSYAHYDGVVFNAKPKRAYFVEEL